MDQAEHVRRETRLGHRRTVSPHLQPPDLSFDVVRHRTLLDIMKCV
jgi:hypothetical protein